MAKIVIFGNRDTASLAHYYLKHDSKHEVVAFSVTKDFLPASTTFEGLPIIPFENIDNDYPPTDFKMFAPMTHNKMGESRKAIYQLIKTKGYQFISYISSRATLYPITPIGDNCFILEDNTIQPYTSIGNNVVLWSGNHIGHHSEIKDDVFFTSHVVLSGHCVVEPCCFLGVNAAVRNNVRLATGTLLGMSACLTRDSDPWSVYMGVPAQKREGLDSRIALASL